MLSGALPSGVACKDSEELQAWVLSAEVGYKKVFDVSQERRKLLHRAVDLINTNSSAIHDFFFINYGIRHLFPTVHSKAHDNPFFPTDCSCARPLVGVNSSAAAAAAGAAMHTDSRLHVVLDPLNQFLFVPCCQDHDFVRSASKSSARSCEGSGLPPDLR